MPRRKRGRLTLGSKAARRRARQGKEPTPPPLPPPREPTPPPPSPPREPTTDAAPEVTRDPRAKFDELKPGDIISRVTYAKVTRVDRGNLGFWGNEGRINVTNDRGLDYSISKDIVESEFFSSTQNSRKRKVTATELSRILRGAGGDAFQVTFNKKPDDKAAEEKLADAMENDMDGKLGNPRKRRKFIRDHILKGEERVLTGRLVHSDRSMVTYTDHGRINVVDLKTQLDSDTPQSARAERQVDPRTITKVVLRDVEYSLK